MKVAAEITVDHELSTNHNLNDALAAITLYITRVFYGLTGSPTVPTL